jgi:hypothetical protein
MTMRNPMALLAAPAIALALLSCTEVVETVPLTVGPLPYGPTCHSAFGAYYLPRALLHVTATAGTDTNTLDTSPLAASLTVVADRTQPLCLDFLSLPNSQDIVTVQRDPKDPALLASISSDVTDQTPQIVTSLIQTGENLAVAARLAPTGTTLPADTADLEFDPFNWDELVTAKKALRRFGYCLYIEGFSFNIRSRDPAHLLAAGRAWCDQANPVPPAVPTDEYSALPIAPEVMSSGVLYRPNITHKVVILRRRDPGGREPWTVYQTKQVDMPNVSPVLSIGVQRAMFANRKTTLNFNKGVLTDVAINKGSELVGFVQIPLALAKAIVDVPGQIVTLRLVDTQNKTALLTAQTQLIQAIAAYRQTTGSNPIVGRSAPLPEERSARIRAACSDAGGPDDLCKSLAGTQQ